MDLVDLPAWQLKTTALESQNLMNED
jgi:hypothetical protein